MEPSPGIFHSRRVQGSLLIALLIIVIAFFASLPPRTENQGGVSIADVPKEGIHEDLDSDGLELWQEDLWGTDVNNADTDGDGTMDGEEVRIGRIPTIKGPKDKIGDAPVATTTNRYYDDDPNLSTTEVVSRDILSAYLAMKSSGTYSETSIADLTEQIAAKSRDRAPIVIPYFLASDVITQKGDSPENYKVYANTLGTIFYQFRDNTKESELVTFARAVEKNDPSILASIGAYEGAYRTIAKLLIATPVPEELASLHLSIANSYVALGESIGYLQRFQEDPVVNIVGVELYSQAISSMNASFPKIRATLIERGVILGENDAGASLFGMIGQ